MLKANRKVVLEWRTSSCTFNVCLVVICGLTFCSKWNVHDGSWNPLYRRFSRQTSSAYSHMVKTLTQATKTIILLTMPQQTYVICEIDASDTFAFLTCSSGKLIHSIPRWNSISKGMQNNSILELVFIDCVFKRNLGLGHRMVFRGRSKFYLKGRGPNPPPPLVFIINGFFNGVGGGFLIMDGGVSILTWIPDFSKCSIFVVNLNPVLAILPVPGTEHFLGSFIFFIKPVFYLPWYSILLIIHHTSRAHVPLTIM